MPARVVTVRVSATESVIRNANGRVKRVVRRPPGMPDAEYIELVRTAMGAYPPPAWEVRCAGALSAQRHTGPGASDVECVALVRTALDVYPPWPVAPPRDAPPIAPPIASAHRVASPVAEDEDGYVLVPATTP